MKNILGTFLILLVALACTNSSSQEMNNSFSEWALKNSQKIETIEITKKQDDLSYDKMIVWAHNVHIAILTIQSAVKNLR